VNAVAEAKGVSPREIAVVVLERDRHEALIDELRAAGAKVLLIRDGDVAPAIAAAQTGTGVDMLYGVGGTPKASSRLLRSSAWRRHPGKAVAARRRGKEEARRRRSRSRPRPHDGRPRLGRGRLRRGDRCDDRLAPARRALSPERCGHRLDRDAITVGTSRRIEATHLLDKLEALTGREYR